MGHMFNLKEKLSDESIHGYNNDSVKNKQDKGILKLKKSFYKYHFSYNNHFRYIHYKIYEWRQLGNIFFIFLIHGFIL